MADFVCDYCGDTFHRKPAQVGENKYCSPECYKKSEKENYNKIEYPCRYKLKSRESDTSYSCKCTEFYDKVYPPKTPPRTVYGLRIYDEESKCGDCEKRITREEFDNLNRSNESS